MSIWAAFLTPGLVQVNNDRVYIGAVDGTVMEVVTMNHELNIGTINGLTIDNILDKMVERGIGLANPGVIFPTTPSLGALINIGDYKYRIVEIDNASGVVYVILAYWKENCKFDSDGSVDYDGSDIAAKCKTWYNNEVPQELKDKGIFIDVNVNRVTEKCFIPTYSQVNPDQGEGIECFDYFKTSGGRVFRNEAENTKYAWWTSTDKGYDYVYCVSTEGAFTGNYAPTANQGFRPALAIAISAFTQATVTA